MKTDEPPAFSHRLKLSTLSAVARDLHLEADDDSRRALSDLWNVAEVQSFIAELQVARWKKDGVRIRGRVKAQIVQACVVTLEPVVSLIDEPVEALFVPEGSRLAKMPVNDSGEMIVDPDGPDFPEIFTGDTVDIGPVIAEHAALAIDPYPRSAGVRFEEHRESDEKAAAKPNPFAVLRDWKKD